MTKETKELVTNRKAGHDYEILDVLETGIVLQGTEIKSIRLHGATLQDAFIKVLGNELWLIGASIAPYRFGNIHNHAEKRDRKLLVHKREIKRLKADSQEKGLTIIPLSLYLKNGRVKVKIATAKGKKRYDKREDIKERDEKRMMQQALKSSHQ